MTKIIYHSDPFKTFDKFFMGSRVLGGIIGRDEASVLSQFEVWIGSKKHNGKIADNRKWVRDSTKQLVVQFEGSFSVHAMRRTLKSLIRQNVLLARTDLNKAGYDETKWFSINFNKLVKLYDASPYTGNLPKHLSSTNAEPKVSKWNTTPSQNGTGGYENGSRGDDSDVTIYRQSPRQFSRQTDDDAEEDVGEFDRSTSPTRGNHETDSVQSQSSVTNSPRTGNSRQMPTDYTAERKASRKLASDRDDQGNPKLKVSAPRQPRTRRASRQEARGAGFSGRGYVPVSRPADYDDRSAEVDTDRLQVFRFYAENMNGGKSIPPFAVRELGFDIRNYGKGLTLEAIKQSVLNGGHTLRYIDSILESWARSGVQTIKDAKLDEKRHTAKIQADQQGRRRRRPRTRHVRSSRSRKIPHAKDGALTVAYLNKYAHTRYSTKNPMYLKMISRLIGQGYTAQDFADVIKYRVQTWGDDAKMKRYIRPTTLFSMRNFDEYLNDARSQGESDGNSDAIQGLATIRHAKQEKQAELQGLKDYFGKKSKEKSPSAQQPTDK